MTSFRVICRAAIVMWLWTGCAAHAPKTVTKPPIAQPPCSAEAPAHTILPDWQPRHDLSDFWVNKRAQPDKVLLDVAQLADFNAQVRSLRESGWPSGRWEFTNLPKDVKQPRQRQLEQLRDFIKATDEGKYVLLSGDKPGQLAADLQKQIEAAQPSAELRIVHHSSPLRCFPTDQGVYEKAWQLPFDLMQCAQLRFAEPVWVMSKGAEFWLVRSTYGEGWVRPAALTPALDEPEQRRYLNPENFAIVLEDHLALYSQAEGDELIADARLGAKLPIIEEKPSALLVLVPSLSGLKPAWIKSPAKVSRGYLALTWRNLITVAFNLLHTPYGWGGLGEYRDCSRLLMDVFGVFGLLLPRNSSHQAQSSRNVISVGGLDEKSKIAMIEETAARGPVLLYMPGHIMLYLGRDGAELYALHQFSGYLVPCAAGGETMRRANRTVVSSLRLGQGGSRGSFLQRITKLVLIQ